MPERHRIAAVEDFDGDRDRAFAEIDGVEVAVFRVDGAFHAVVNFCVHQGAPLCEGERRGRYEVGSDGWELEWVDDGSTVVCPWHGWKFDVTDGRCVDDDRYRVPTYEVEVEDGVVYVRR
jgi:nitrite reductase/ring-hydroxylating ferredoxin subunit